MLPRPFRRPPDRPRPAGGGRGRNAGRGGVAAEAGAGRGAGRRTAGSAQVATAADTLGGLARPASPGRWVPRPVGRGTWRPVRSGAAASAPWAGCLCCSSPSLSCGPTTRTWWSCACVSTGRAALGLSSASPGAASARPRVRPPEPGRGARFGPGVSGQCPASEMEGAAPLAWPLCPAVRGVAVPSAGVPRALLARALGRGRSRRGCEPEVLAQPPAAPAAPSRKLGAGDFELLATPATGSPRTTQSVASAQLPEGPRGALSGEPRHRAGCRRRERGDDAAPAPRGVLRPEAQMRTRAGELACNNLVKTAFLRGRDRFGSEGLREGFETNMSTFKKVVSYL